MTWIKWEDECINLNALSHVSGLVESMGTGKMTVGRRGPPRWEIRLAATGGRCVLVKKFESKRKAEEALDKLENALLKSNYDNYVS